ncbi:hypothetical protein LOTGIDRAFT_172305 [Lottia gigantea]|uniref:Neurotransmitter-gated ion-channel ligand-binding domain-containing protein n=1 Tax=Lottia gigantea TaxID=225164 RepID=V4B8A4_LOTGI|nr:hypothetical protein LOTGIDRAFT_172305 [Lottia gigantea]ESP01932.1 hypothetical protein LOTGIDRAFT_172305 [Lottia gigantea]
MPVTKLSGFLVLLVSCTYKGTLGFTIGNETALRNSIFEEKRYDVNVRPNSHVLVSVMFNLLAINELNIREQKFSVSGWFTMRWTDRRLAWNTSEYGDVQFLFATQTDVWKPALVISNSIDDFEVIRDLYAPLRIDSKGTLVWEPPGIYQVNCQADIKFYPFDEQECHITLQSWGYNLIEVNLTALYNGISFREFKPNGEWNLEDNRTESLTAVDAKGDSNGRLIFFFKLTRKSQYYWLNVLLPVIVNSVLTALVFALPAESGEKMGYSLTVLLSFAVLLTLIADKIPSTSLTTPVIVVYFSIVLVMGALAVLLSTFVLDLYFMDETQPISNWLMMLFRDILGRMVCYKGCRSPCRSGTDVHPTQLTDLQEKKSTERKSSTIKRETFKRESSLHHLGINRKDDLTWKDIANILDIIFFRMYCFIIVTVTVGFLTAAYNHIG